MQGLQERTWAANEGLRQWEEEKQGGSHREVGFGLAMKEDRYVNAVPETLPLKGRD